MFSSKRISSETRLARFIRSLPAINRFVVTNRNMLGFHLIVLALMLWAVTSLPVLAENDLSFGALPAVALALPEPTQTDGLWQWKGQPEYKQERLAMYQNELKERGITDPDVTKYFVAMIIQENGTLSENHDGATDKGCSIGIAQRNVCQFGYTAKSFRVAFPEWKTAEKQIAWLAESMAGAYEKYGHDVRLAIISHNRPASANAGVDRCMNRKTFKLVSSCPVGSASCSCYFRDEVSQHLSSLELK